METILWENENGKSPLSKFINDKKISKTVRSKIILKMERIEQIGLQCLEDSNTYIKLQGHDLYEIRLNIEKKFFRIFFSINNNICYFLHGFIKKSNNTKTKEIETALKRQLTIKNK